jgi:hypothetical protein
MTATQLLQVVDVATPCHAEWNSMTGDDRSRFCGQCRKNVYNLSAMSADQAVALIREKEGDLCVRLYRRTDGTVLTGDCPVGVGRVWRRFKAVVSGVTAACVLGCGAAFLPNVTYSSSIPDGAGSPVSSTIPLRQRCVELWEDLRAWLGFTPATTPPVMGDICITGIMAPLPSPSGPPVTGPRFPTLPESPPPPPQAEPASEF